MPKIFTPAHRFTLKYFFDQTVGVWLCGCLGILRCFFKPFLRVVPAAGAVRTILVLKWFGIGSLILIQPLLKNIKKTYPGCRLIFLTFSGNKKLLEVFGNCDEIIALNLLDIFFPWHVFSVLFYLRRQRIDIGMDLEFFSSFSTLMLFLSGARKRIGFYLPYFWRRSLLTDPVSFNYLRHISQNYRAAGRLIGVDYDDLKPQAVVLPDKVKDGVRQYLQEKGWRAGKSLIGLNVNAGEMAYSRRWPKENFVQLIKEILKNFPETFLILTGSREEKAYVGEVYGSLLPQEQARVINSSGELSLEEFIGLVNLMTLFVTNDSGPLHLAYAQGIATVSFWGPQSPTFYGLKGPVHEALYMSLDCSPCLSLYRTQPGYLCGNQASCLKNITPAQAFAAVSRVLKPTGEAGR